MSSIDTFNKPNRQESEKPAGTYRENIAGEHCGALQSKNSICLNLIMFGGLNGLSREKDAKPEVTQRYTVHI
jgi:hypothetical protein